MRKKFLCKDLSFRMEKFSDEGYLNGRSIKLIFFTSIFVLNFAFNNYI